MSLVTGRGRDRIRRADGTVETTAWRANLLMRSGLDLLAALLIGDSDRGAAWLAVGRGDPAWDTNPIEAQPARRTLFDEAVRVSLRPGSIQLSYLAARGVVRVRASLGPGVATGQLRELAVFGGNGSARPDSGTMINHLIHPVIDKGAGDTVVRELELDFSGGLDPDLVSALGARLANASSAGSLQGVAIGTGDGAADPGRLAQEQFRRAALPGEIRYDDARATVMVETAFDADDLHREWPTDSSGRPLAVREVGLVVGDQLIDGSIALRQTIAPRPLDGPSPMVHRFELSLGTDVAITVPDVVGRRLDEVQQLLGTGLVVGDVDEIDRPGVSATQVISQHPAAGATTPELSAVDLTVVRRRTVLVPAVIGLDLVQATTAITARSLTVDSQVPVVVPNEQVGRVVGVEPPPGATVDRDSSVILHLGEAARVEMPDLTGLPLESARRTLATLGFGDSVVVEAVPRPWGLGTVVQQSPVAGATVALNETVTLGQATAITIAVPPLVDLSIDAATDAVRVLAEETARTHGLQPGPAAVAIGSIRATPSDADPSLVMAQDPAPGAALQLYGTVDVVIAVGEKVLVPDLARLPEDDVAAALGARGLRLGPVRQRSVLVDPGLVVDQDPKPDTVLRVGQPVAVTVSATSRVVVPNLAGMGLDGVVEALSARALRLGSDDTVVADGLPGTVISQTPSAGAKVDADSEVAVRLVAGVPDVVGLTVDDAQRALQALNLTAQIIGVPGGGVPGTVLSQEPRGGAAVPNNRRIVLRVATAVTIDVPNLVGQDPNTAARLADEVGLRFDVAGTERVNNQIPAGRVVRQDPVAGDDVAPDTVIRAWLQAENLVEVPDLVGASIDEAQAKLDELGLIAKIGDEVRVDGEPGTVGAMVPKPGVRVPPQSTVVISPVASQQVVLADLRGLLLDEAVERVRGLGLQPEPIDSFRGVDVARRVDRHVVSHKPGAGPVEVGQTVEIVAGILLPRLVGRDAQTTTVGLKQLELDVSVVDQRGRPASSGTILQQTPPADTPVVRGQRIVLVVQGFGIGGGIGGGGIGGGGIIDIGRPPIDIGRPPIVGGGGRVPFR